MRSNLFFLYDQPSFFFFWSLLHFLWGDGGYVFLRRPVCSTFEREEGDVLFSLLWCSCLWHSPFGGGRRIPGHVRPAPPSTSFPPGEEFFFRLSVKKILVVGPHRARRRISGRTPTTFSRTGSAFSALFSFRDSLLKARSPALRRRTSTA